MSLIRDKYGNWVENDASYAKTVREGTYKDPKPNDKSFARHLARVENEITSLPNGMYSNQADFTSDTTSKMLQMLIQKSLNQGYVDRGEWTQDKANNQNALIDKFTSQLNNKYTIANNLRAQGLSSDPSNISQIQNGSQTQPVYSSLYNAIASNNPNTTNYSSAGNTQTYSQDPLITALKTRLQQNIANRKSQSQPLRDNSEVQKANELRTILEQNANAGDRGEVGRQNALATQTAGENRLNQINLAENSDIANMQSDANVQEANIMAQREQQAKEEQRYQDQLAYQRLRDSIMDGRYTDETSYNRERDTITDNRYNDETTYNREMDTIKRQDEFNDKEWERSVNNPAYKQQLLNNEILQLQLSNLPTQLKQDATILQQQVESGRISIDTAKEQLRQLKSKYSGGSNNKSSSSSGYALKW